MLVNGLQTYLTNDAGMQAQLGTPSQRSDKTTGIFPSMALEQCSMPYLVMQQVSGQPLSETLQGTGALQSARWRFSCYGSSYAQAKKLAKALKLAMISLNGNLAGTDSKTYVEGSWMRLEIDETEPITKGTIYSTHVDFEINFFDNDVP